MLASLPEVILKFAVSLDGCFDDVSSDRLRFSGEDDIDDVDELRSGCDAILIGAETLRRDNPRLLLRSKDRRTSRVASGLPADPLKVCLSNSGNFSLESDFFQVGEGKRLVYTKRSVATRLKSIFEASAELVGWDENTISLPVLLADLSSRGVRRLLVEGGPNILEQFIRANLSDSFRIAVGSKILGESAAPRLFQTTFPIGEFSRLPEVSHLQMFQELFVMSGRFSARS